MMLLRALPFALAALVPQSAPRCGGRTARRARALVALEPPLAPRDELKSRFTRGDEETQTSFAPDPVRREAATPEAPPERVSQNAKLLAEIRSMQPEPLAPRPERQPIDLNGIQPSMLLLGAGSYGVFSVLAWQFTISAAEYFAANPFESAFYVVQRLSGVARVVVVALGSLGTGITCIAALGQLALAVQVSDGIRKGELDPTKERVDPYGGRKKGELEKMLGFMMGDKDAGM